MQLGQIPSEDLALFLSLPQQLFGEMEEARELLLSRKEVFFANDVVSPAWCHFYEMPIKDHAGLVLVSMMGSEVLQRLSEAPNQIQEMLAAAAEFQVELDGDDKELDEETANEMRKCWAALFGQVLSITYSFRSLMIFGSYLNDLIAIVRSGGEYAGNALLKAVKIDPTVLACPSVSAYYSAAVMQNNEKFLRKVRQAMNGKLSTLQARNYQQMRLALQVLHESGAGKLSGEDLYHLFVEEMNLIQGDVNRDQGDVANNLRQFAYQFMKQKSGS